MQVTIILSLFIMEAYYNIVIKKRSPLSGLLSSIMVVSSTQTINLILLQFIFLVLCVKTRYNIVNKNLHFYFLISNHSPTINSSKQIIRITKLHTKLTDAIDLINSHFSVQMIIPFFIILIGDSFLFYNFFLEILNEGLGKRMSLKKKFCWFSLTTFYVSFAIYIANEIINIGRRTLMKTLEFKSVSANDNVLLRVSFYCFKKSVLTMYII